ncbi:MAG: hypothetical protein JXA10_14175 [Anaerolineae bacterium]|nr:hypothetical protein [Anaerolineae bacterium]
MAPHHFSHTHLDELAIALDFSRADLAANRRGQLTDRQIAALRAEYRRRQWPKLTAWIVLGGVAGLLAMLDVALATQWLLVGIGIVVLGGMSVYERTMQRLTEAQLVSHGVTLHIGPAWQKRRRLPALPFPITVEIEGQTFSAPPALGSLLRDGQRYRVYYVPACGHTKNAADAPYRILSMEPLGPAIPVPQDTQRVA